MRFPLDGGVELYFTHSQDERPRTVSNVSCDKSPCAIASWNSYENVSFTYEQIEEQGKYLIHVWLLFVYFSTINAGYVIRSVFVHWCSVKKDVRWYTGLIIWVLRWVLLVWTHSDIVGLCYHVFPNRRHDYFTSVCEDLGFLFHFMENTFAFQPPMMA